MKKLLTIMFLFLTLTSPVFGNSDELILICKDKLKTGAEGKYYDKEVSYKLQSFVVKLNKKKKIVELKDEGSDITHYLLESNYDLLFFSDMMNTSLRLQKFQDTDLWQYYRSSIFGLKQSIYVSSGLCYGI